MGRGTQATPSSFVVTPFATAHRIDESAERHRCDAVSTDRDRLNVREFVDAEKREFASVPAAFYAAER